MRIISLVGLLVALVLNTGCASSVKPWQKGHLAKPIMSLEPDPLEARFDRHIYDSKEAASGGYGAGGGGCGCN